MGETSAIEWTDATWNPVSGCTKVSPGCDHCYAETLAERFRGGKAWPNGFDLTLRPKRLDEPFKWREPKRVFVNSMSDLFHDGISDDYIAHVFAVMALAPRHTFQVLTKRHARMRSLLTDEDFRGLVSGYIVAYNVEEGRDDSHLCWPERADDWWPLDNVWLGVSVEDQKWADIRIPVLLDTPAAIRFLSCEPLLGPVSLDPWRVPGHAPNPLMPADTRLGWVIVGGESGHGSRPIEAEWVRTLRDQCVLARVPFFFKQWGGRTPKAGGRELDGRTWSEYPTRPAAVAS